MDHQFIDRFRHVLNADVSRRLLIRYFIKKGFDNFDRLVYPGQIQDLPLAIPELSDKIEIVPHALNVDMFNDSAKLGWNLFVLGNQRQFLGETYHHGLKTLAMQLQQGQVMSEDQHATRQTTPRRIINFIIRTLETRWGGYVDLTPRVSTANMAFNSPIGGQSSQFFSRMGGAGTGAGF